MYKKNKHSREKIGIWLILLFFCSPFLSYMFPVYSYLDDIVALMMLMYFIVNKLTKKIPKQTFQIIVGIIFLALLGLTYNYVYCIQPSNSAVLLDLFNCLKFFIIAIAALDYFKSIDSDYVIRKLGRIFVIITLCLFVLALLNLVFDFGMRDEIRYGIPAFKFLCENAGQFNYCCYYIIAVLTAYYFVMPKQSSKYIICGLIVFGLTLRTRTFIFIGIYLFMFLYFTKAKVINKKLVAFFFVIAIPLFFMGSYTQIDKYFMNENVARARFWIAGLDIFKDYFPFGTGFGSYGTAQAAEHYSMLYFNYGLSTVWGLRPDNPAFGNDNFWPSIIVQLGLIGTIVYTWLLIIVFRIYNQRFKNNKYQMMFYFILVIILLSSFVTAAFYHYSTMGLVILVAICNKTSNQVEG